MKVRHFVVVSSNSRMKAVARGPPGRARSFYIEWERFFLECLILNSPGTRCKTRAKCIQQGCFHCTSATTLGLSAAPKPIKNFLQALLGETTTVKCKQVHDLAHLTEQVPGKLLEMNVSAALLLRDVKYSKHPKSTFVKRKDFPLPLGMVLL